MQPSSTMHRCRAASSRRWLGAALAVLLLLAEAFAVAHAYDDAAHSDGQRCAVCLSVADFGAAAVAADLAFVLDAAVPELAAPVAPVPASSAPVRRFARGPPSVSFAS